MNPIKRCIMKIPNLTPSTLITPIIPKVQSIIQITMLLTYSAAVTMFIIFSMGDYGDRQYITIDFEKYNPNKTQIGTNEQLVMTSLFHAGVIREQRFYTNHESYVLGVVENRNGDNELHILIEGKCDTTIKYGSCGIMMESWRLMTQRKTISFKAWFLEDTTGFEIYISVHELDESPGIKGPIVTFGGFSPNKCDAGTHFRIDCRDYTDHDGWIDMINSHTYTTIILDEAFWERLRGSTNSFLTVNQRERPINEILGSNWGFSTGCISVVVITLQFLYGRQLTLVDNMEQLTHSDHLTGEEVHRKVDQEVKM